MSRDLRDGKEYPRSPRETLGGYVLAARVVDKCRAVLCEPGGRIPFQLSARPAMADSQSPYDAFKSFVATGATDEEMAS